MPSSFERVSDVLRDLYMGPNRIEAVPVRAWTCRKHRKPVPDKYKEVCQYEQLTGEACPDKYDCPHVISIKVKDGCPDCKAAEWATVLDAMTGEEIWEAKLFSTMAWELNQERILLSEALNRKAYGDA